MSHPIDDRAGFSVETAELTFLRALGRVLTKEYRRGSAGKVMKRSAPNAREFAVRRVLVNDFASFAAALFDAERRADECLIRGAPGSLFPHDGERVMRRLHHEHGFCRSSGTYIAQQEAKRLRMQPNVCWLAPFAEVPTRRVMVDIDGVPSPDGAAWVANPEAAAEFIRDNYLPAMFQDVSCWWQITASAHDPSKEGGRDLIRLRLGFWLSRALTENQLVRLFQGTPADPATFRVVQPIYVARPVFRDGIADPIPCRSGILVGLDDVAEVPELPDAPLPKRAGVRGWVPGAEGEGLHECEAFEEALARAGSGAGECRKGLERAAFAYVRAVGARRTDAAALANRLAEAALEHRGEAEVAGYNLGGLVQWVLGTFAQDPEPAPDPFGDPEPALEEPTPDEASAALDAAIRAFVEDGLAYLPEPGRAVPHKGIRAVAGLSKTSTLLRVLAEIAAGKTVHFFVPTHSLAAEVAAQAQSLGIPATVIKGRDRPDGSGEEGAKMCRKADIAKDVAAAGLPVWDSLCELRERGRLVQGQRCEHFLGCPYVSQFEGIEGRLIVMAHEWLHLPQGRLPVADLIVIDERFYTSLLRTRSFPAERVARELSPFDLIRENGKAPIDRQAHAATAEATKAALDHGQHPREHGVTQQALETAAKVETALVDLPMIMPGMGKREQRRKAAEYAKANEGLAIARMFRLLAEDFERDWPSQRVALAKGIEWHGELQDRVFLHWRREIKWHARGPALLIDADLDETIAARLLPLAGVTDIQVRLNADVTQVADTVCSRRKLLGSGSGRGEQRTAERVRARIEALAAREAQAGKRVLVASYKPAAEAMQPPPDGALVHFGSIRGLDLFKDFDTVVIAGREQPPPLEVEAQARCLFGDDAEPLGLTGEYVTSQRRYITRDGVSRSGPVSVHPGPRCQALLEQCRERETEQAVARLRLVHRVEPARVLLLSNLPTRLPVDRLVRWNEIMPTKQEQATAEAGGIELHSASELARVYPERWATKAAAKKWRARQAQKGATFSHMNHYGNMSPLSGRLVRYRLHGQVRGSPHQAWIPAEHCGSLFAAADALTPIVGDVAIIEWAE